MITTTLRHVWGGDRLMNMGSDLTKDRENNMGVTRPRLFAAFSAFASGLFGADTLAQSQGDVSGRPVLEEIVVTASKREESLQDVSVSAAAFSGDDVNALRFDNGLGAPDYSLNGVIWIFQDLGSLGHLTYQFDGRYQDDTFLFPDNNPYEFQDAYGVWTARLSWNSADDIHSVTGFVENAGDQDYITYALQFTPTALSSFGFRTNGLPHLWGVKFAMTLQQLPGTT